MAEYNIILFDLDGTITDPKVGITKSVQFALQRMGIDEADLERLTPFIGPPLKDSFQTLYGMNEDEATLAVSYYREYFSEQGLYQNFLYGDMTELLEKLKDKGKRLIVATSKPTVFSEQILKYFHVDQYFDAIVGSNLDGTRSAKAEIIEYIMKTHAQFTVQDFVMIGDRKYDIAGAVTHGIDSIAVTYGYGSRQELAEAKPTYIVDSVQGLWEVLS